MADKVRDVRADRHLSAESCTVHPMGAENAPNDLLRLSRIPAQIAGACALQD
jgi:hypothetical protein